MPESMSIEGPAEAGHYKRVTMSTAVQVDTTTQTEVAWRGFAPG